MSIGQYSTNRFVVSHIWAPACFGISEHFIGFGSLIEVIFVNFDITDKIMNSLKELSRSRDTENKPIYFTVYWIKQLIIDSKNLLKHFGALPCM